MRIFSPLIMLLIFNSSWAIAKDELEIQDIKLGAKLEDLYPLLQESCQIMPRPREASEDPQSPPIKTCLLRNDADFQVGDYTVQKGVFRFIKDELFHATFDFKRKCDCFKSISTFLATLYGSPTHSEENVDLIRYERRKTRITFHKLSGVPRLWWYNVPLLIEANTIILRSDLVGI